MAGSVNKVMLLGNVGRDPEIRTTQGGSKIANLALATSESWTDKSSGERKEKTEWHRVSVMNDRTVDVVERFVKKGSKLFIEGQLQTRKWTDQQGQEKYSTEIVIGRFNGSLVLVDRANGDSGSEHQSSSNGSRGNYRAGPTAQERQQGAANPRWDAGTGSDLDSEIPF